MFGARAAETAHRAGGGMSAVRRIALGFPLTWSHRRAYSLAAIARPGDAPYFISWEPHSGIYGEDFTCAPRDRAGVLLGGGSRRYHAIRIAQFALHRYDVWHATNDSSAREDFFAQATYLRDAQEDGSVTGLYRFGFPWTKYGAPAGWSSAMAQGEAISVLLRAEAARPGRGYGDAALRAATPFAYDVRHGGVVTRDGREVFFEEIAVEPAAHVLNGCIFALFGLWELAQRTGIVWIRELVGDVFATLRNRLPRYDTGWWSLYSLMRSASGHPHVATLKYHAFHVAQLHVLAAMSNDAFFDETADRWEKYIERADCRSRVLADAARSIPERMLRQDTVAGGAHV